MLLEQQKRLSSNLRWYAKSVMDGRVTSATSNSLCHHTASLVSTVRSSTVQQVPRADSQSRERVKYGHESRMTALARPSSNLPVPWAIWIQSTPPLYFSDIHFNFILIYV
jgi:hypothetical protein